MKRLIVEQAQCTGCESCVLSCSFVQEGVFMLDLARIQVERVEQQAIFSPRVCVQCDGRFCIKACPTGALTVDDELGFIRVNPDVCTGCRACESACPFSGIHFAGSGSLPLICNLCGGEPACVAACEKPRAIRYDEVGEKHE